MQTKQCKVEVVIFAVIGNPVVQQKEKKDDSNTSQRSGKSFPKFEQARFSVNVGVLPGDVINGYPECRNKNKRQIKVTIEFYRYFIAEFNRLDIKFPVNVKECPTYNCGKNIEYQIPGYM
jgi:hypothetical protein